MDIKIIGISCPKTERTFLNAQVAAGEWGFEDQVQLITDINVITKYGIVHMPAVFINHKEKASGRIPSLYEMRKWIKDEIDQEVAA
ncbi:MAG: thioredoxin family protein [Bacteroidota bacterium]